MVARFPFARGHVDPLVAVRSTLNIEAWLRQPHKPIPGIAQRRISLFVLSGYQVLICTGAQGRHLLHIDATEVPALALAQDARAVYGIGATSDDTYHVAVSIDEAARDRLLSAVRSGAITPLRTLGSPKEGAGASGQLVSTLVGASSAADKELGVPENCDIAWADLRHVAHLFSDDDSAVATSAVALDAWHRDSRFCTHCGSASSITDAGWTRTCGRCDHVEYPRQDPAMIVAVFDDEERLLLAHNVAWRPRVMSLIAGFVDAGEDPERTVIRELREEVGIEVDNVEFIGAQPWPFPRSTMIAYRARLAAQRLQVPRPDGIEIDRAHFFSRTELRARLADGSLELPSPTSVARAVIDDWLSRS